MGKAQRRAWLRAAWSSAPPTWGQHITSSSHGVSLGFCSSQLAPQSFHPESKNPAPTEGQKVLLGKVIQPHRWMPGQIRVFNLTETSRRPQGMASLPTHPFPLSYAPASCSTMPTSLYAGYPTITQTLLTPPPTPTHKPTSLLPLPYLLLPRPTGCGVPP